MAGLVAVSGVSWQEHHKHSAQLRDMQETKIEDGCLVLANGHLPQVRDVTDPVLLGVHRAAPARAPRGYQTAQRGEHAPAYVPRDLDADLRERLARGGFVLLVGDSTAGKTRAAFEAMKATLADHVLLCPVNREAVPIAVSHAARARRCVLWLDDLEDYLGTGDLTAAHIGRLLIGEGHHRVVIATIRAAELARITADGSPADDAARQVARDVRQILAQAHHIGVPRMFTGPELERARALAWDPRVAEALRHARSYGVAEYLAAGPELLRDWENARNSSQGPNARGAALVAAAVDIRRAGYTSPIPRSLLDEVHEHYLADPGHVRIPREPAADAWAWATRQRQATTALLQAVAQDRVEIFDYLVDIIQNRAPHGGDIPERVSRAAIKTAGHADADSMAATAYAHSRYFLAANAWKRAWQTKTSDPGLGPEHASTLASRNKRALLLCELGRLPEAEAEHRAILAIRLRKLGSDHPDTLASRNNLGLVLRGLGRLAEAEAEHRASLEIRSRVLGPKHPDTLASRANVALVQREGGRLREAEAELRAVHEIRARVIGTGHPDTLESQSRIAFFHGEHGKLSEAETELRALLDTCRRTLGPEHSSTLTCRNNLAVILRGLGRLTEAEKEHRSILDTIVGVFGPEHPAIMTCRHDIALALTEQGRLAEAEKEFRKVLEIRARVLGPDHPSTLRNRASLASVLWSLGRHEEAEAGHRAVVKSCIRTLGPGHPSTLASRDNLASMLRSLGRLSEAEAEYRAVFNATTQLLGPDHPDTLASRSNIALLLADRGSLAKAESEHRSVAEIRARVLGPDHPSTLASRIDVALILWEQGRLAEAEREHRAVLGIRSQALGVQNGLTATNPETLYTELRDLGMLADAAAEHRVVVDVIAGVWSIEHPSGLGGETNRNNVLRGLSRLAAADAEHRAVQHAQRHPASTAPQTRLEHHKGVFDKPA